MPINEGASLLGATVRGSAETVGVSVRGNTQTVGLVELLDLIQGNGHAGTLKLILGDQAVKLHFYKGQIYLPLGGTRGSYRIGALLVRAGKLNGRDLLRALQIQKSEGHRERLGDLLVRQKLVERKDLDHVIRTQFEEEICDLLFEAGAYFEFKKDVLPANFADAKGNIQALGFDTRSILMEASRRKDEWEQIHSVIPSTRTIYRLAPVTSGTWHVDADGQLASESAGTPLADVGKQVLARWAKVDALFEENPIDGTRSVDELVAASGVTAFVAMGVVADLRRQGLIRPLAPSEVEASVLDYLRQGQLRQAYRLFEWANEAEGLRSTAANLDKVLLRKEHLKGTHFSTRTTSERAVQMLSRLLRRGSPFRFLAREGESMVEVYFSPTSLRLHLLGPRRTHSTTRYLRRRRSLSSSDLERAKRDAKKKNRSLDRILVEEGYVAKDQWIRAVKDKAVSGLFSIFGWSEAHVEVQGGRISPPPAKDVPGGLVIELPLNEDLRASIRRDLLRWKVLLREIATPDVIYVCVKPTRRGERRRAHDLFDGRRSVGDLIRLARVAPLELVRFVYDCARTKRIRRLTDREHYENLERARERERHDDAISYCKSAVAFGYAPQLYGQRLTELRRRKPGQRKVEGQHLLEGDLESFGLAEVLQLLLQTRISGTLKITDGERDKSFYVHEGNLHVLNQDNSESDQEIWDLLIGEETRMSLNLGELLDGKRGSIDESEVGKGALHSIKEEILDVFLWEGARFEFFQNLLPTAIRQETESATTVSLRLQGILIEAMGVMSEWDEIRAVIRSTAAVYRYSSPPAQLRAIQSGLGSTAYLFDGKHTVGQVAKISGEPRLKLYRLLRDLVEDGSLALVGIRKPSTHRTAKRKPLASGRIPRLKISDQEDPRDTRKRRRLSSTGHSADSEPVMETDIDFAGLGDSFAEEDLDDSFRLDGEGWG